MRRNLIALFVLLLIALALVVLPVVPALASPSLQTTSPLPFPTPYGPYSYRLGEWTDEEARQALSSLQKNLTEAASDSAAWQQHQIYSPLDYWRASNVLLAENIARFPDAADSETWRAQLASQRAGANQWLDASEESFRHSVEPFRSLFEEALNAEKADPADPTDWATSLDPGFSVTVVTAPNLFGTREDNFVFEVDYQNSRDALFVLRGNQPGSYKLFSLYPTWMGGFDPSRLQIIEDVNANGIAEVLVKFIWKDTGPNAQCGQSLDIFEWDRATIFNIAANLDEIGVDNKVSTGDCLGWSLEPAGNGTQAIVSTVQVNKSQRRTVYEWNRKVFAWARTEIVLDPVENTIDWALTAGPRNDQAVEMLETWLAAWPADFNTQWGPASEDYFRFKLGTWYAFRGQKEQALAAMERVRDKPANPKFKTAALWADTFLRGYRSRARIYQGCDMVMERFREDREAFRQPEAPALAQTFTGFKEAWGFSEPTWGREPFANDPRVTGREDYLNLCSTEEAFRTAIRNSGVQTRGELVNWLALQHIQWAGLEEGDIDGDCREDWVILINSGPMGNLQLWALFHQGSEIVAEVVTDFETTDRDLPTTWFHFLPEYSTPTHNLYVARNEIVVFRAIQKEGQVGFEFPLDAPLRERYNWDEVHTVVLIEKSLYEILTVHEKDGDRQTFLWDPKSFQIRLTGPSQDSRVSEIEDLLFLKGKTNYEKAADIAAHFLVNGLHESIEWHRGIAPARVRPQVMYLLALAYEMDGRSDKAMLAYWKLWNDYPASPYAQIAKAKLDKTW